MTPLPLRLVFCGTPDFAVPGLQWLLNHPDIAQVVGVMTQPDRPVGRGQKLTPPPVKVLAEAHGVPVCQPERLRKDPEAKAWLATLAPDIVITIAFGQILDAEVLAIPSLGVVNVHASLLPQYRGANPIQQAILDGQPETGLTTMLTELGVDTGPMLCRATTPIALNDTAQTLHDKLAPLAGPLLGDTLTGLANGTLLPQLQPHDLATHAPKRHKDDAWVDWSLPAAVIHNRIRGSVPWPGSQSLFGAQVIKLAHSQLARPEDTPDALINAPTPGQWLTCEAGKGLLVQCGNVPLWIGQCQPSGKTLMPAAQWLQGLQLKHEALSTGSYGFQAKAPVAVVGA